MDALSARLLLVAVVAATSAVVGRVILDPPGAAWTGSFAGAALCLLCILVRDAARGARLTEWIRGSHGAEAPRDSGFWGELGYRIEKAVRALELDAVIERRRLEQFVQAMDASPNGVLLLDANDAIAWCNARAAQHFGLDPLRDRQQHVTNLIRMPAFVEYIQGGAFEEPVPVRSPSGGGTIAVLARRYGEGSTLVISQDLTDRERSEAMRRDFVANVSHEIRTPLSVLAGSLETLHTLPLGETDRTRVFGLMKEQVDRMSTLVEDLLTLAQLEGSPRPGAGRWIPLAGLLRAVEADARALSGGRHALAFGDVGTLEVAGSDAELRSAVANLLSNAIRYTPEGGSIDVSWHASPQGGGQLAVADTGVGIAREHLPRLTERFYRVDSGRSREAGGTGLGLAIVKHVIERHGGELDVTSEPGRGSTFRLRLPALRVRTAGGDAPRAEARHPALLDSKT